MPNFETVDDYIAAFSNENKEYKQGKGSVQFPVDKPLPKELIILNRL
jgi:uncharacterized protein YdhG (YjbR/CyaY superfamily)